MRFRPPKSVNHRIRLPRVSISTARWLTLPRARRSRFPVDVRFPLGRSQHQRLVIERTVAPDPPRHRRRSPVFRQGLIRLLERGVGASGPDRAVRQSTPFGEKYELGKVIVVSPWPDRKREWGSPCRSEREPARPSGAEMLSTTRQAQLAQPISGHRHGYGRTVDESCELGTRVVEQRAGTCPRYGQFVLLTTRLMGR